MGENDESSAVEEIIRAIPANSTNKRSWTTSGFLIASWSLADMPNNGLNDRWAENRARASLVTKFFSNGIPTTADLTDLSQYGDERAMFFGVDRELEIDDVAEFKQGFSVAKFSNLRSDGGTVPSVNNPDTDIPFLRAAEAYLTFAEATLRAGGSSSEALNAFNAIRERANVNTYSSIDINAVLDEKAREFFFESQRRTD